MRIAYGRSTELKGSISYPDLLSQHLTGLTNNRDVLASEAHLAHFYPDKFALVQYLGLDYAALRFHGKEVVADQFPVPQIPAKNTKAVAAFFRLTSVRVVYLKRKGSLCGWQWAGKDTVRSDAVVSIANGLDQFRLKHQGRVLVFWIKNQIVVTEGVIFGKFHMWLARR